ncbi:primase-like DNA-binding domain-containing protein [Natrarchaeobius chitinivorans]|uniref:DNA primase/nucleoside triphosphatase C-terminal domain-containing protein n=1 Tax=Natrarchaeobius chitinivorans TaxID=1679083 RepID=A0A3N6M3F3_NATCH|nr:primase-like DNA-binding domain-containing protein [Natrarchaeobius chitinivorans]RQG89731.1 hypothetical protein EA473_21405 [Natrarchaeobius chitinivorans]
MTLARDAPARSNTISRIEESDSLTAVRSLSSTGQEQSDDSASTPDSKSGCGSPTPDSSESLSEGCSSNSSQCVDFGTFVEECLIEKEHAEIAKDGLYNAYEAWADAHDQEAYAKSWFGRKLSEHVSYDECRPTRDDKRVRHYTGITLSSYGRTFLE